MAEITTMRADIRDLRGVHLFHFGLSNCSQRVRLALAEKKVAWISHIVSLAKNEHQTPAFQALNPAGVVPVLVHDGRTYTESNDIIDYIDAHFGGPALTPTLDADRAFLAETLEQSSAIQDSLKLVAHEFLFKPLRRMSAKQLDAFAKSCSDPELVQFMRDFSSPQGFGEVRIRAAVDDFVRAFNALDLRLQSNAWVSGDQFGLADVSWFVNVHRLALMGYPVDRHARLSNWYRQMKARPSFRPAIADHQPFAATLFFTGYSQIRRLRGTGIRSYLVPS